MMAAKELLVPSTAAANGNEVLRAFIANGGLQVSIVRGFEQPATWGLLLADVARHAARIFAMETSLSEADVLAQICDMFDAEMARPTDLGSTEQLHEN
jgi:hypothetical protein